MSDDDVILLSSGDSNPTSPVADTESNDIEILTPIVKQEVSVSKRELKPDKSLLDAFLRELSELPDSTQESSGTKDNEEPPNKLNKTEISPSISNEISPKCSQEVYLTRQEVSEPKLEIKPDRSLLDAQVLALTSSQKTNAISNEMSSRISQGNSGISQNNKLKPQELQALVKTEKCLESQEINDFEKVVIKSEFPDNPICKTPEETEREYPSTPDTGNDEWMSVSTTKTNKTMTLLNSPPIYNFERKSQKRLYPMSPIASPSKLMGKSCSMNLMEGTKKEKYVAVNSAKSSPSQTCDYEVEKILDQTELGPERFLYKVKWKGFEETESTWEPLENLTNCLQLVYEFKCKHSRIPANPLERRYLQLRKYMLQHTETDMNLLTQRFRSDKGELSIPKIDVNEINGFIRNFARHPHLIETNKAELNYLREQLLTSILHEKRLVQLENLKRYEMEINVTTGNAVAPIYVINNADLEVVPVNFTHTNHNIPTEGVVVNEEPIIWCECVDNCKNSTYCCGQLNDSVTAYDQHKRLKIEQGTPIYECNKNCKCNSSCRNRVIQLGTQVKLAIYKTYNGCGWGIQTLEAIPKGTFVTEYVGEILTFQEASRRLNQTYLFNLDFNGSTAYVIDACNYGNISHFINHSCSPNLAVYPAYIQCLDPNLHRLPLFAIRDIEKGEELSFSYYKSVTKQSSRTTSGSGIKCKCESKNCRGWLNIEV